MGPVNTGAEENLRMMFAGGYSAAKSLRSSFDYGKNIFKSEKIRRI